MADDNNNFSSDDHSSNVSPSTLFLEMMRQAALRNADNAADDLPQEPDFSALEFHIAPDDPAIDAPVTNTLIDPIDTRYIPESDLFPHADSAPNDVRYDAIPSNEPEIEADPTPNNDPVSLVASEAISVDEIATGHDPVPIAHGRVPVYTAPDEHERASKLEEQRVRRLHRRQQRQQKRRVGMLGGFLQTSFAVLVAAVLASTVFTWFTDPDFFTDRVVTGLQVADSTSVAAVAPLLPTTNNVTPNWAQRIGIVSGHRGPENDPGAVCDDGLTENEINFGVAQLVVRNLRERGYSVDLLDEFDPRLQSYQAASLVSIHSNDCSDYGEFVSGYLVARAAARPAGGLDDILAECIAREYEAVGIERRYSLTIDMTDYHTFREISSLTPAAIIELGFMRGDRDLLVNQQGLIANSITEGIVCYLRGENPITTGTEMPTFTPEPSVTPFGG